MSRETDIRAKNAEEKAVALEKRIDEHDQKLADLERFIREFWEVYQEEKPKRK